MIDTQTTLTEALRKRRRTARTYVGDKGRDDPETTILKAVGIDSRAKLEKAKKVASNVLDLPDAMTANEVVNSKNVADFLQKKFPNWTWVIGYYREVLLIRCREISLKWGPNWPHAGVPPDSWLLKQAGEYLERYRAPRALKGVDQYNRFISEDARYGYGRGGFQMLGDK